MFTGIIEALGEVKALRHEQSNLHITVASPISGELKVDQSVAHDGICLTVTELGEGTHTVTAIQETLDKTALSHWQAGSRINLERCMPAHGRFDGHIVQGHVDQSAECIEATETDGSWRYTFAYDASKGNLTVEKGSITINGVSLTVVDSKEGQFSVAIIPYTYEHTNFHQLKVGSRVNLEFDILGKYLQAILQRQQQA